MFSKTTPPFIITLDYATALITLWCHWIRLARFC